VVSAGCLVLASIPLLARTLCHAELIARVLCEFRRTSRNRPYAPARRLLRGVWPSIMYNDHALAPPNGQNPTDFWPSRWPRNPPAAPAAVPAANLGPGTRPSRPQPPTGGTDGIQPAARSPATPRWCRPAHARAGWWCGGVVQRSPQATLPAAPEGTATRRCHPVRERTGFPSAPFGKLKAKT
jgi:hypothetical protein